MPKQSPGDPAPDLRDLRAGAHLLGLELNEAQLSQFRSLGQELVAWNGRANLTSITNPREVEIKHFVDSLTVTPWLQHHLPLGRGSIVDVGAGAGLPGLALAIVFRDADVTMIEATQKKVDFIRHAVDVLGLPNATVIEGRAEELARTAESREQYDVAVARAVGSVASLVELLMPLVRLNGYALLMKTAAKVAEEINSARFALEELQSTVEETLELDLPGFLSDRTIVVLHKNGSTRDRYPRRNGIPQRRPLLQS